MRIDTGRLRVVGGDALEPPQAQGGVPPSPGAYIREHRERRGMSLEELAVATKVPKASLALVEEDRFSELPGMVFAKGFLRCCARVLDLDEDTVLGLMYEQERRGPADGERNRRSRRELGEGLVVPASQVPSSPIPAGPLLSSPNPAATQPEAAPSQAHSISGVVVGPELSADPGDRVGVSAQVAGERAEQAVARTPVADKVRAGAQALSLELPSWVLRLRDRVTAPRLLLWLLVAAFVVLVVFLAFTIASGQRGGDLRL